MKDAYGHADGDVLTGVERAAHSGRRMTARHARRNKRTRPNTRGWSLGPLTITPALALMIAALLVTGAAGAAVALNGSRAPAHKQAGGATPAHKVSSSTRPSTSVAPAAKSIYVRFPDAAGTVHYMYCTKAAGCGLLDVAKNGSSTIAVSSRTGVWHRVQRTVLRHNPCINIIDKLQQVGKPGDLVSVMTTDLHQSGTQTIKGISVPARIAGTVTLAFQYPVVPNCTFSGTTGYAHPVSARVTEYVPAAK